MTVPKTRTMYISSMVKSLAQKEQHHRGDLRKKVLLKTTRRRYKQPLQRTRPITKKEVRDSEEIELKVTAEYETEIRDYGCNLAQVSLPTLVCCVLVMLGCLICTFGYTRS